MDPIIGVLIKLVLIGIACAATLDIVLPYEREKRKKKIVTALIFILLAEIAWFTL